MSRPPLPPFTAETAAQKVAHGRRRVEQPATRRGSSLAYTIDSRWRNRAEFLQGRAAIEAFLTRKWARELDYRLIKELWAFARQSHRRAFRLRMARRLRPLVSQLRQRELGVRRARADAPRIASINDLPIAETERKYHWPLGRRPDDHPGLSDLGL